MTKRYWIAARHDRAETHHETLQGAARAALALRAEGYGEVAVLRWGSTDPAWDTEELCAEHGVGDLTEFGAHGLVCGPCADREVAECDGEVRS